MATMLVGVAAPASAQSKTDVSLEYQIQHTSSGGSGTTFPVGFNADVSGRIAPNLSVFGQVDWSHKSESVTALGVNASASLNITGFGGGIRWSETKNKKVTPYVQVGFGAAHLSGSAGDSDTGTTSASATDAMLQLGGGVAFPLSKNVAGVGQFDYRRIFSDDINSARFLFGIRWMAK